MLVPVLAAPVPPPFGRVEPAGRASHETVALLQPRLANSTPKYVGGGGGHRGGADNAGQDEGTESDSGDLHGFDGWRWILRLFEEPVRRRKKRSLCLGC